MFKELKAISSRPKPFEFYTACELWTDAHTSRKMLSFHLDEDIDVSSRKMAFIDRSVEWICSYFKLRPGVRIIDFGCGPGLYTTRLARKKAVVTGIDFSENSLLYARESAAREKLKIHYFHTNYLDFETQERFDLILMIMCDFCALSPDQRSHLLNKFYNILAPGGAVLLDVYSLSAFARRKEESIYAPNLLNGFWSPKPYFGFRTTYRYEKEKVVLDKFTIIESHQTRTVYNWLQYFSPEALEKEVSRSGLAVKALFADVAGRSYDQATDEFAVLARKPN